jgi:hypothetical protein
MKQENQVTQNKRLFSEFLRIIKYRYLGLHRNNGKVQKSRKNSQKSY